MTDKHETILELYKLHVEMADRVSHRRGVVNQLFITLHASVFALIGLTLSRPEQYVKPLLVICILGSGLSLIWIFLIISYKKLNHAKFKVINAIEKEHLPISPFIDEYNYYTKDKRKDFSSIEKGIPIFLIIIYLFTIILALAS